jgi:hypothetical protein
MSRTVQHKPIETSADTRAQKIISCNAQHSVLTGTYFLPKQKANLNKAEFCSLKQNAM